MYITYSKAADSKLVIVINPEAPSSPEPFNISILK
jgi:hypothetical protein